MQHAIMDDLPFLQNDDCGNAGQKMMLTHDDDIFNIAPFHKAFIVSFS